MQNRIGSCNRTSVLTYPRTQKVALETTWLHNFLFKTVIQTRRNTLRCSRTALLLLLWRLTVSWLLMWLSRTSGSDDVSFKTLHGVCDHWIIKPFCSRRAAGCIAPTGEVYVVVQASTQRWKTMSTGPQRGHTKSFKVFSSSISVFG